MERESKRIQSVQRAVDIMNCIEQAKGGLLLREISARLNLNSNTVRGLANTLLMNGFLSKDASNGRYYLGYEFLSKSQAVYHSQVSRIREAAYPFMQEIAGRYHVSCWLQVNFYRHIYTVETIVAPGCQYAYTPKSGALLPLHCTASGKLHIAHLPLEERQRILDTLEYRQYTPFTIMDRERLWREIEQAWRQGYAVEREEVDLGFSSIGVPVFDTKDMLIGTLSIAAPSSVVEGIFADVVPALKQAGQFVTVSLFRHS